MDKFQETQNLPRLNCEETEENRKPQRNRPITSKEIQAIIQKSLDK